MTKDISELPHIEAKGNGWPWEIEKPVITDSTRTQYLPKLSIITPSYNQASYLEETIRSVLLQNYPNLEYIIIDGGSTDGSVEIIKNYEPWLTYWVSEPDRGQAHAINKGFQRASGEILAWINSDDIYQPYAFLQAATFFLNNQDAIAIYGNVNSIDKDGNFLMTHFPPQLSPSNLLIDHIVPPQPSSFFDKNALHLIGLLDEKYQFCMDVDIWFKLSILGCIKHFPFTFSSYRMHNESKSSTLQTVRWDEFIKILHIFFNRNDVPVDWMKNKSNSIGSAYWKASIENFHKSNTDKVIKYIAEAISLFPQYLKTKSFSSYLVGNSPIDVNENAQEYYLNYLKLIPDKLGYKNNARKIVLARYFALLALKPGLQAGKASTYSKQAIRLDPYWLHNKYLLKNLFIST
jgi:glycosyltransferase involved in cell wall biosynthesis